MAAEVDRLLLVLVLEDLHVAPGVYWDLVEVHS